MNVPERGKKELDYDLIILIFNSISRLLDQYESRLFYVFLRFLSKFGVEKYSALEF